MIYGHWTYKEEFNPDEYFGFIYLITNKITGKKYIGKKQFHRHYTKKVVDRNNKQHLKKESNWKEYTSSCDDLNADIELIGKDNFTFEIIQLHLTKGDLSYAEMSEQFRCDVLRAINDQGERLYYNKAVGNTPMRLCIWTEEMKETQRQKNLGRRIIKY